MRGGAARCTLASDECAAAWHAAAAERGVACVPASVAADAGAPAWHRRPTTARPPARPPRPPLPRPGRAAADDVAPACTPASVAADAAAPLAAGRRRPTWSARWRRRAAAAWHATDDDSGDACIAASVAADAAVPTGNPPPMTLSTCAPAVAASAAAVRLHAAAADRGVPARRVAADAARPPGSRCRRRCRRLHAHGGRLRRRRAAWHAAATGRRRLHADRDRLPRPGTPLPTMRRPPARRRPSPPPLLPVLPPPRPRRPAPRARPQRPPPRRRRHLRLYRPRCAVFSLALAARAKQTKPWRSRSSSRRRATPQPRSSSAAQ